MAHKYKIGDRVQILDPVPEGKTVATVYEMKRMAGKITEIMGMSERSYASDGFIYYLGDDRWTWESHMFVPAPNFELNPDDDENDIQFTSFESFIDAFKAPTI